MARSPNNKLQPVLINDSGRAPYLKNDELNLYRKADQFEDADDDDQNGGNPKEKDLSQLDILQLTQESQDNQAADVYPGDKDQYVLSQTVYNNSPVKPVASPGFVSTANEYKKSVTAVNEVQMRNKKKKFGFRQHVP